MLLNLTLLCSLLALASGNPLHTQRANSLHGFYDKNGYYHKGRARVDLQQQHHYHTGYKAAPKQGEPELCKTAKYTGRRGVSTYVHVCEIGSGGSSGKRSYCFITNGPCCALSPDSPSPTRRYQLTLGTQSVNVDFYASFSGLGACYDLGTDVHTDIPNCCIEPEECAPPVCIGNTITGDDSTCVDGSCRCTEGFAPPDCCECDLEGRSGQHHYRDPGTGECLPYCRMNCNVSSINVTGCAECTSGFRPPDCCQCDTGYYNNEGTCRPFCPGNTITGDASSCEASGCQCRVGYTGDNCCESSCSGDIYFVIDATNSNDPRDFCQTQYGLELLIAALGPNSGTHISAILYPYIKKTTVNQPFVLFERGTSCPEAVGKLHTIIDGVNIRDEKNTNNSYLNIRPQIINGFETHPVTAIQKVTEMIEQGINNGEPRNRHHVVAVFTDGGNDQRDDDLRDAAENLNAISDSLTLIALGDPEHVDSYEEFERVLRIIAGDNTVISQDGLKLARGLVEKMIDAGAICEDDGNVILGRLTNIQNNAVKTFCGCISNALINSNCDGPTTCELGATGDSDERNEWYFRSPNYDASLYPQAASTQGMHINKDENELEEEILEAVEEVLQERLGRA